MPHKTKTINILMLSILTLFQNTSLASENYSQSDLCDQESSSVRISRPSASAAPSVAVSTSFLIPQAPIMENLLIERDLSFLLPQQDRVFRTSLLHTVNPWIDKPYSCIVSGSPPPPKKSSLYLTLLNKVEQISPPDELSSPSVSLIRYSLLMTRWNIVKEGAEDDTVDCMPNEPDEILAQFFLFLPTTDYIQASRVSKRFYRVARDKQVLIAHFEQITRKSNLSRTKIITEKFNNLWPSTNSLEQKEMEIQTFDADFKEEVTSLWKEIKFHSLMLRKDPLEFVGNNGLYFNMLDRLRMGSAIKYSGLSSQINKTLKKLIKLEEIVNRHKARGSVLDQKFVAYASAFIPQLDEHQVRRCKFNLWQLVPQLQPFMMPKFNLLLHLQFHSLPPLILPMLPLEHEEDQDDQGPGDDVQ